MSRDCPDFRGHGHQPKVGRGAIGRRGAAVVGMVARIGENGTVPLGRTTIIIAVNRAFSLPHIKNADKWPKIALNCR
jgi:hypothetical protein